MNWISVFAPATIGNIGPGFDVLGMAVRGIGDIVDARRIPRGVKISAISPRIKLPRDPAKNTAGIAAVHVLELLGWPGGVELNIRKGIPSGSGLGSSAASAAAAAFAVNRLYGSKLTTKQLIVPATRAEAVVSGGFFADNTAPALLGGVTLTRCCMPLDIVEIGSIGKLILVLVTPRVTILTRHARKILPAKVPLRSFVSNMANAALITAAFAKDDYALFARSLHDVIIEPVRSKLIKGFDRAKQSALAAGADGMTISGAGPTVFAITDNPGKAEAIRDHMTMAFSAAGVATHSCVTSMDPRGARAISSHDVHTRCFSIVR